MLPKAVRARQALRGRRASSRSARATAPTRWWRCSPSTTAAPRRSAPRPASSRTSSQPIHAQGAALPRGGRRRRRGAVLEPARRSATTRPRAGRPPTHDPATRRADRREAGRRRAAAGPRGRGDRGLGGVPRVPPPPGGPRRGSATCTARSAPASGTRASARRSIEHYQKGIDLLKDGPPCLELVRLYEEAASLYMHTGDNMLAIYASEKALRLAERLGEAARGEPRARDLRPRVRPDRRHRARRARTSSARSSWPASSDHGETIRALLTLGYHLEVSEADYAGAGERLRARRSTLAEQIGDLPVAGRAARGARPARRLPRATGRRSSARPRRARSLAEREGLVGKLCFPYVMRGLLRWREGDCDEAASAAPARARARRAGRAVGGRVPVPLLARGGAARQRGDHADADTELARALDLCERAGPRRPVGRGDLGARGQPRARRHGRTRPARPPRRPTRLADRLRYPVGKAASLEARGAAAADARGRRAPR